MAVDEAHLLNTWGQSFCKDFQQIGWVWARFQHCIPIAAVTATLQVGGPTDRVWKFLGFEDGHHHVIQRSNYCPDIKLIFRTMKNGLESGNFSDLDWIVDNSAGRRRTLIFLGTVAAGFHAQIYFWKKLADDPHRAKRVCMFNAVNHKHYNDKTLTLWRKKDPDAQIIIATSILSVGIDAPTFDDVIIYGQPSDTDEFIQDYGRLRFMKSVSPRAFLYVTKNARTKAEQVLASKLPVGKEPLKQAHHTSRSPLELDSLQPSMAKLILSSCKVAQLDELYGNILDEPPCSCLTCQAQPRPRHKEVCDCSGCVPETAQEQESVEDLKVDNKVIEEEQSENQAHTYRRNRLTKKMREYGIMELMKWWAEVWEAADDQMEGCLSPKAYLPDTVIKSILDVIFSLTTVADIAHMTADTSLHPYHCEGLFTAVEHIVEHMKAMKAKEQGAAYQGREENIQQEGQVAIAEMEASGIRWVLNNQ